MTVADKRDINRENQGNTWGADKKERKKVKGKRKAIDKNKILIIVAIVALIWVLFITVMRASTPDTTDMKYTEFMQMAQEGKIESVNMYTSSNYFTVKTMDGKTLSVPNPRHDTYRKDIMDLGIEVNIAQQTVSDAIHSMLVQLPLYAFMAVFIYYLLSSVGTMTRSYIRCATIQEGITFDKVAGMSEVKNELQFAIDFLKKPSAYRDSGARVPKGMLMVGPPGTGKTLLAKAVAGEAGVPFISTSGSDFCEMFAGLGARRVRDLFDFARTNAPCVVFIDEIDSLGSRRTSNTDAVSRDGNQTLNALLKEMDGIGSILGVFVMAATNTPENLDPALVRPGRFDRQISVGPPTNKEDREAIIDVHLHGKMVDKDINLNDISKMMVGFTGAEIEVVLNEAVIVSLMDKREGVINLKDIDTAITKMVTKGVQKKVIKNEELRTVAIHEAGHAITMLARGKGVNKVTIIPSSSGVGGFTMPDLEQTEGKLLNTKSDIETDILALYGGLCAEEVILGEHSNGCVNDIQVATDKIREYLNKYIMGSFKVDVSKLSKEVETDEVLNLAYKFYKDTIKILTENKDKLIKLSDRLYDEETIYRLSSIDNI